ncbi:MAG: CPBP family intramembrane glutamic endopeptidase, partial [Planctomycetota bacterium]
RKTFLELLVFVLAVLTIPIYNSISHNILYREFPAVSNEGISSIHYYSSNVIYTLSAIITMVAGLTICLYLVYNARDNLENLGFHFKGWDLLHALLLALTMALAFFIIVIVIAVVLVAAGWDASDLEGVGGESDAVRASRAQSSYALLFKILLLMIVPLYEEICFRAYLITRLKKIGAPAWSVAIVVPLIGGAMHTYQGILPALMATFIFLGFTVYYLRYRRLWPIILLHFLFNVKLLFY